MNYFWLFFVLAIFCAIFSKQIDKRIKIKYAKELFIILSAVLFIITLYLIIRMGLKH